MCECHGTTRRTVLRGFFGVAVAGAASCWLPASAVAAEPAGSVTATDVTLTPALADPKAGDAVFGLTWLAGDTHVHDDHSSDGSFLRQTVGQGSPGNLSVADQVTKGSLAGLAWMPLTDHRTYDQHWDPLWTSDSVVLIPGEEANGSPHAVVLGGIDEIVDAGNPAGSANHRHVQQSIWEAHAQGAAWGTAHPTYSSGQAVTDNTNLIGPDWIEVFNPSSNLDADVDFAEARWNAGFRTGVSGGCDDHFKELWSVAGPGQPTTFVLTAATTERAILDALHAGRTTVGSNPAGVPGTARQVVLEADFDGDGTYEAVGGDETHVRAGRTGTLRITVTNGSGASLLVYSSPGRSAGPLVNQLITLPTQVFTVPVTTAPGAAWWRAELRGAGTPGLKQLPTGLPTAGSGVPTLPVDPTDQLLAASAPVFTFTSAPAVPGVPTGPPAALAAATADDSTSPVALGEPGSFTGFPHLAVADGVTHLVAEQHAGGATRIAYRRDEDAATVLSTGTAARFPRVAVSGSDVYVVWEQDTETQLPHRHDIHLAHSSDGGLSFAAPVALTASPSGGRAVRPDVAVLTDGTPVVVWQANASGSAFDIVALVGLAGTAVNLSGAGKTIAAASATDTRSASYPASLFPAVAALPTGGAAVIWQDDRYDVDPLFTGHTTSSGSSTDTTDPDAWEPMVAVLSSGGSWGSPVRVAPDPTSAQRHPSLVARADGVLVAAWDAKSATSSSGSDPKLRYAVSRDGGVSWSAWRGLDDAAPGTSQRPRLGLDPDGRVRVGWHDSRSADWRWRVRTATFDDATGWTGTQDVSTAGVSMFPAVAGGFATWTTDRGAAVQRDRTHRVVLASLVPATPVAALAESPLAVALPLAAVGAGAVAVALRAHLRRS